jgi:hypothetical protein
MISLSFNVGNIDAVLQIYDRIQIRRYDETPPPATPVDITDYVTISGTDSINSRENVSDVLLNSRYSQYYFLDPVGISEDWYVSRYYNDSDGTASAWADPIIGEAGDIYYDPAFPPEVEYGTSDQMIIDRIRLYIGDPIGLRREYGEEALSSIHGDGKTYEMDETGWPAFINMAGEQYTSIDNPSVNGYRFLRFSEYIDEICTECVTYSGSCGEDVSKDVSQGVDIWYYTFRWSDRQIIEHYNNCPPPAPLTTDTATSEVYMVQTAIDLLRSELWEDSTEDGAMIKDEGSTYNPEPGLKIRKDLLDDLLKRRDDLIKTLQLTGIEGVAID